MRETKELVYLNVHLKYQGTFRTTWFERLYVLELFARFVQLHWFYLTVGNVCMK